MNDKKSLDFSFGIHRQPDFSWISKTGQGIRSAFEWLLFMLSLITLSFFIMYIFFSIFDGGEGCDCSIDNLDQY